MMLWSMGPRQIMGLSPGIEAGPWRSFYALGFDRVDALFGRGAGFFQRA